MDGSVMVLMASPLLGPESWEPVADELRGRGMEVAIAAARDVRSPEDVLSQLTDAAAEAGTRALLVPHSNAGLYAPSVAHETGSHGIIFVDAALPPASGTAKLAPAELRAHLSPLVDQDGLLPPWTEWWPETELAELFPDAPSRSRVEAGLPQLPLSYFEASVGGPRGWTTGACAYLAFGRTYREEVDRARGLGWPHRIVPGGHLQQLHDPAGVTDTILELAHEIAGG